MIQFATEEHLLSS